MFDNPETNQKAETIKGWLANHRSLINQQQLAKKFGFSRSFISLILNKRYVAPRAEEVINEMYQYLVDEFDLE